MAFTQPWGSWRCQSSSVMTSCWALSPCMRLPTAAMVNSSVICTSSACCPCRSAFRSYIPDKTVGTQHLAMDGYQILRLSP